MPWACAVDWPRAPSKEAWFLLMMLFPDWRIQQFDLLLMTRMLVALVSVFAAAVAIGQLRSEGRRVDPLLPVRFQHRL